MLSHLTSTSFPTGLTNQPIVKCWKCCANDLKWTSSDKSKWSKMNSIMDRSIWTRRKIHLIFAIFVIQFIDLSVTRKYSILFRLLFFISLSQSYCSTANFSSVCGPGRVDDFAMQARRGFALNERYSDLNLLWPPRNLKLCDRSTVMQKSRLDAINTRKGMRKQAA